MCSVLNNTQLNKHMWWRESARAREREKVVYDSDNIEASSDEHRNGYKLWNSCLIYSSGGLFMCRISCDTCSVHMNNVWLESAKNSQTSNGNLVGSSLHTLSHGSHHHKSMPLIVIRCYACFQYSAHKNM